MPHQNSPSYRSSSSTANACSVSSTSSSQITAKYQHKSYRCAFCYHRVTYDVYMLYTTTTKKCQHRFCNICIRNYLDGTLRDPCYTDYATIECPGYGCKECFTVTDTFLSKFFNKDEIDAWWSAALERSFIKNKVRCPKLDCKAIFDANDDDVQECTFTECYECFRGFCMFCQKNWHTTNDEVVNASSKKAEEIKDAKKALKHAAQNGWIPCPGCNYIVEKQSGGCNSLDCFCGTNFCYDCGRDLKGEGIHTCKDIKRRIDARREMFDYNTL